MFVGVDAYLLAEDELDFIWILRVEHRYHILLDRVEYLLAKLVLLATSRSLCQRWGPTGQT